MGKTVSQSRRLAAIFVSFAILFVGTLSLLESMSIDYYSVLNTLQKILPASLAMGCIGWIMGGILDKPRNNKKSTIYNKLYLNELINQDEITEGEPLTDITNSIE